MPTSYTPEQNRKYRAAWRARNPGYDNAMAARYRATGRATALRTARRAGPRAELAAIKVARGCADCGYNAHPAALDFDHTGDDKTANVSQMVSRGRAAALAEAVKCVVVCANYHRVRTVQRLSVHAD